MTAMFNWTENDLAILAGLYLQNERSFVVRRLTQRFLAGELTAREVIEHIRRQPGVIDEDSFPDHVPRTFNE